MERANRMESSHEVIGEADLGNHGRDAVMRGVWRGVSGVLVE